MPKLNPNEQAFYQRVATRIRELRLACKGRPVSQSKLARELGFNPNTVSRWESGEFRPTAHDLWAIARFFEVPIGTLFTEDDDLSLTANINIALRDLTKDDLREMLVYAQVRGRINKCDAHSR
jgi:transcriptional regulator with XRE-family HTH domain